MLLSPEGAVLVTSLGTKSSNPRALLSLIFRVGLSPSLVFVLEWDCLHPYGTTTALMFGNYNNQCIQVIRTGT